MKSITSCPKQNTLNEAQIKNLANPLVTIIKNFYDNPKNEEEFKKWLLNVEKQ